MVVKHKGIKLGSYNESIYGYYIYNEVKDKHYIKYYNKGNFKMEKEEIYEDSICISLNKFDANNNEIYEDDYIQYLSKKYQLKFCKDTYNIYLYENINGDMFYVGDNVNKAILKNTKEWFKIN